MSSSRNKTTLSDEFSNDGDGKIKDILDRMAAKANNVEKTEKTKEKNKNEINYDDVEFDKLDENERKSLKDLFTGMPDIYKITGSSLEDSQSVINKKCAEKLKMYHPDRHSEIVKKLPEEKRTKELKKLDIQFKLLRDADSILRDPTKRKYYDLQKKTIHSKNFVAQKESFDDYLKLQKSKITEQSKALAENDHKLGYLAMDKKHGFNRQKFEQVALTPDETSRLYSDLMDGRIQDDIEYLPDNKFEKQPWNQEDFNKMFIKGKLKEEKKSRGKHDADNSIIAWEGISAVNDLGMGGATDYVSIDHNYEDLYSDKNFKGSSLYASRLDSDIGSDFSENSSDIGDDIDLDEYDGYKNDRDDVNDRFASMMNKRTSENTEYDNREMHNKKSWKSVLDNPFSISSSMGTVLGGTDFSKLDGPKQKKTINREYANVYKELVYENIDSENDSNVLELPKKEKKHKKHKKDKDGKN